MVDLNRLVDLPGITSRSQITKIIIIIKSLFGSSVSLQMPPSLSEINRRESTSIFGGEKRGFIYIHYISGGCWCLKEGKPNFGLHHKIPIFFILPIHFISVYLTIFRPDNTSLSCFHQKAWSSLLFNFKFLFIRKSFKWLGQNTVDNIPIVCHFIQFALLSNCLKF